MRTIAAVAVLLLGISCALPAFEPAVAPLLQTIKPSGRPAAPATAPKPGSTPIPTPALAASVPPYSLDDVCSTLVTSAQDNDLPVTFFANLIWQESRLRENALSPKGAMGIAQFMPKVAANSGVENPFDPSQALPASAKLLRELFNHFGNLGYVAAAYNAGTQRVSDWIEHGRSLPRETRNYVMDITGRSIEAWRKKPQDDADLRFARQLPCSSLPAFAALTQAQAQPAELDRKQGEEAHAQLTPSQQKAPAPTAAAVRPQEVAKAAATAQREKRARLAEDAHPRKAIGQRVVRVAERERPRIKREASARIHDVPREARHRRA